MVYVEQELSLLQIELELLCMGDACLAFALFGLLACFFFVIQHPTERYDHCSLAKEDRYVPQEGEPCCKWPQECVEEQDRSDCSYGKPAKKAYARPLPTKSPRAEGDWNGHETATDCASQVQQICGQTERKNCGADEQAERKR